MKNVLIVIPARFRSKRFPGKILHPLNGKPLLFHTWKNAVNAGSAIDVVIATDHEKVYKYAESLGASVMMTSTEHSNGTERLAEVAKEKTDYDLYINLQGDEPLISGLFLSEFAKKCLARKSDIYSLMKNIDSEDAEKSQYVKVVTNHENKAMYFSRSKIPYPRNHTDNYKKHIGLYAFTGMAFKQIMKMKTCQIEKSESLEQLRWLYYGLEIQMIETSAEFHGVDLPEDVPIVEKLLSNL